MNSTTSKEKVLSVTELTTLLKDLIEGTFPTISLEGEISNYRPNASGHLYFTLKDQNAQISAVMFRYKAQSLSFMPKDGMKVLCRGSLSVYQARGNYQIIINSMEMAGEGNILLMLEERKRKLYEEGLFDDAHKKPLPIFPRTIGIVTSPTGAALRDIMQIVRRRNKNVSMIIFPAIVQGNEAAQTICNQIKIANDFKMCDVLIVGRGGGSLEDLLPFSEENVVRAVASSNIPIISAVGHEIDWALCDFAADERAPTPSAAAELATPILDDVISYIKDKANIIYTNIKQRLDALRLMVNEFNPEMLELRFRTIEQPLLSRFDNAKDELLQNMQDRLTEVRHRTERLTLIIENANPATLLERGYSIVRESKSAKIIRNASSVKQGTKIEIVPFKGKICATVDYTE